jgi:hypothetical protein
VRPPPHPGGSAPGTTATRAMIASWRPAAKQRRALPEARTERGLPARDLALLAPATGLPGPRPNAVFEPPRINPLNREPDAKPEPDAASAFRGIDPMNPEPATAGPTAVFDFPRINPMNRYYGANAKTLDWTESGLIPTSEFNLLRLPFSWTMRT